MEAYLLMQCITEKQSNQINTLCRNKTKKRAHDSQIVRAKKTS